VQNLSLSFPLHEFEQAIQADPEVLGVLYTGSLGRGTVDRFSDLDIEVWVRDNVLPSATTKLQQILQYLGEVQFFYHSGLDARGFVGPDWRRVDLDFKRRVDLQPAPKYMTARVVKDTDGVLAHLVAASPMPHITATVEQAEDMIREAIDSQIYLALHNARGAVWSAMGEVSYRCAELYTLLARLRGHQSFGFRYVEVLLSPDEQRLLTAAWPTEPTQVEVRRAARALWTWTRHVWVESERILGKALTVTIDEARFLIAVGSIYTWK
jgi:hypothetical protein